MAEQIIACAINALSRKERGQHFDLVRQWRDAVKEVSELPDGYAFGFPPESTILVGLAEFVSRERLCCPFFHFEIVVEPNKGPIWLHLRGKEGVKDFVRESLIVG